MDVDSSHGATDTEIEGEDGSSAPPEEIRCKPRDGETRESRLKHAIIFRERNPNTSLTAIAARWEIPYSTLHRHCTRKVKRKGGQPVFTARQEAVFEGHLLMCADALWPVTTDQFKDYVAKFIKVNNYKEHRFRNGRPGKDWIYGFMRRHPELRRRRAATISASKAYGTSPDKLREFFSRLEPILLPGSESYCTPDCVMNYDETAIGDDAGSPIVFVRRSTKAPRAVLANNKTNRSVMFSVTADGLTLPPYVVTKTKFKEEDISAFKEPECFWNTSKSGWFNMHTFDDWFEKVVVPWARSKGGKPKVIIGDNLSSHLSPVSLKRAGELGIGFRLLPPNTTHYLQPLDVTYFGPLKRAWRENLLLYKQKHGNKSLLKKHFADELKKLIARGNPENIITGFRTVGLVPFDPEAAVLRMPLKEQKSQTLDECGSVLAESLGLKAQNEVRPRNNKLPPAGQELAAVRQESTSEHVQQGPSMEDVESTLNESRINERCVNASEEDAEATTSNKSRNNKRCVNASEEDASTPRRSKRLKPVVLLNKLNSETIKRWTGNANVSLNI